MKFKELKVKPVTELHDLLEEKREALRVMRFKVEQRQLKKVHDIKNTRHMIAQIQTLLKQKDVEAKNIETKKAETEQVK